MMKLKKIVSISLILVMAICIVSMANGQSVSAKVKNGYYSSTFSNDIHQGDVITKIKFKGNKVTIWGTFSMGKTKEAAWEDPQRLGFKKRTFTLSKKTKYCFSAMMKERRTSKKDFIKTCNLYCKSSNGIGLLIQVKKGKVVKMLYHS